MNTKDFALQEFGRLRRQHAFGCSRPPAGFSRKSVSERATRGRSNARFQKNCEQKAAIEAAVVEARPWMAEVALVAGRPARSRDPQGNGEHGWMRAQAFAKTRPWMAEVKLKTDEPVRSRKPATKQRAWMREKQWSRPVSRVLCALRRDSHSSRPGVTAWLKRPTRERRGPRHRSPIWSCFGWGLPCRSVARLAVRSCRTVSPLPDPLAGPSAVCSLLRCPSARAAQALPGTLPFEARTFLGVQSERRDCPADSTGHSISRRTNPCATHR